jgi:hypothetical protein
MNYNLCKILMKNFLTLLNLWAKCPLKGHEFMNLFMNLFAVSGGWILWGTLRLRKLGLCDGFELPNWESIHSVFFVNEGRSHKWTKSKTQRQKSEFEV